MKILHIITSLQTGGAEKLMVDLLPRMKAKGVDVDLLLMDGTETKFRRQIEASGIKVYDLGKGGSVYSPLKLIKLIPYLRKYEIVHTHNTAAQLFAAIGSVFVLCSVVLCTTEHTTSNRRRGWKWYAPIDQWMYNRYKSIISISDKTQENLKKHLPLLKTKLLVIYNGIPIDDYIISERNREIDSKYADIVKIVMVAGFRYQKDHPTAIRSLLSMPNNYHLFLVGDGVEREKCENLVTDLKLNDRIHFLGVRSDVASILKSADISVISSHSEGFGLAAVEAMAAGIPVVASDIPGVAEVVRGAGVLFEKGNPDDLAEKIKGLISNKTFYDDTVAKCLTRARQFDISKMVDGYMKVYSEIIN